MVITNQVLPKSATSINATLADGLLVEKGTISGNTVTANTKYYKLTVRYKYSDTINQSEDLNQTLISGFTMEEGQMSVTETVTFNAGSRALSTPTNITATMGSTYGSLPETQVNGDYFIEGWYTDNLYTEKVESDSTVLKSGNHTLYANWEKVVRCIDDNGKTIACPTTLTLGQRVAIGNETFRYIRTTDTTSNLNECGTTSSITCTDTDSRNNIGSNKLRLLAEYNLKRTGNANSGTAIASNALQDKNDTGYINSIQYSSVNADYKQSYLKTYLNNYAIKLNTLLVNVTLHANALSNQEAISIFGCPSFQEGRCSNIYPWTNNTTYWMSTPYASNYVLGIYNGNKDISWDSIFNLYEDSNNTRYGARPVIMISETDFNHYR